MKLDMKLKSAMCGGRSGGFSLIELLVVVSIIGILAALSLPVVQKITKKGKEAQSMSNLRQIGSALAAYTVDNNGTYPLLSTTNYNPPYWSEQITPYLGAPNKDVSIYYATPNKYVSQILMSPLVAKGRHHFLSDYGANMDVMHLPGGSNTTGNSNELTLGGMSCGSRVVAVAEAQVPYNGKSRGSWYINTNEYISSGTSVPTVSQPSDRDTGFILSLFLDGHVIAIDKQDFVSNRRQYLLINP